MSNYNTEKSNRQDENYEQCFTNTSEEEFAEERQVFNINDGSDQTSWRCRKIFQEQLTNIVQQYDESKASRMRDCGTSLEFGWENGKPKLIRGCFCHTRICSMCQWRRSKKLGYQMQKMIEYISSYDDKKYGYIFITLTQRNVKGYELAGEIDTVIKAYHELMRITNVKDALEGSMRTLEVTYNEKDDTYHPHIHIFACVDEEKYFRRRKHSLYITNVDLRQYWRRSLRKVAGAERYPDSAVMSIKIQEVRNKYSDEQNADVSQYKAICEACKYPTKPIKWRAIPKEMRADVLSTIDGALKGRRLIGYMGVFKEAKNVLFKDDNVEGEKSDLNDYYTDVDVRTMVYVWRNGLYIPYKD